jgi:hypothetical protein
MLKTGTVPVSDQIQRVPAAPQDSESHPLGNKVRYVLTRWGSQGQDTGCAGRRRRGRAAEAAGRDGHVRRLGWHGKRIWCQMHRTMACPQTFWASDRSRPGDPEQMDEKKCSAESFRDWRWRIGDCIHDCEGREDEGRTKGGSRLYNFRIILIKPTVLVSHSCLTGWLEDCIWRAA